MMWNLLRDKAGRPLITGLAVRSPPPPVQMLKCPCGETLNPKLLLMVRPAPCVVAPCYPCVSEWVNEWQKPCKVLWIKSLHKM